MRDALLVLLTVLATYRLTRFVTKDTLVEEWRERLVDRLEWKRVEVAVDFPQGEALVKGSWSGERVEWKGGSGHRAVIISTPRPLWSRKIAYLVECAWCASIWLGGLLVVVVNILTSVPYPWLVWLAASAVTGYLASREPD